MAITQVKGKIYIFPAPRNFSFPVLITTTCTYAELTTPLPFMVVIFLIFPILWSPVYASVKNTVYSACFSTLQNESDGAHYVASFFPIMMMFWEIYQHFRTEFCFARFHCCRIFHESELTFERLIIKHPAANSRVGGSPPQRSP